MINLWKKTSLALILGLCVIAPVHAEEAPPPATVAQDGEPWWYSKIKSQISQPQSLCSDCTTIASAQVDRATDQFHILMEVHASTQSLVALPHATGEAVLQSVLVNGRSSAAVAEHDGVAYVLVPEGVHNIRLGFFVRAGNGVLNWPQKPQQVTVNGAGWSGVANNVLVSDGLSWSSGTTTEFKGNYLTPFVRVKRVLKMNAQWEIETTVERVAPSAGGFEVRVPLLPNEQPQTSLSVEDSHVVVAFGHSNTDVSWRSALPITNLMVWKPISAQWGEEWWSIEADERWAIEAHGLPSSASNSWNFYPVGAENLQLKIQQPQSRKGAVARIKQMNMEWTVTQRGRQALLQFVTEANNGGEVALNIPKTWRLMDNTNEMSVGQDGVVRFTVQPGEQQWSVNFISDEGSSLRTISPKFVFNIPVHNTTIKPNFGDERRPNRWIVGLGGDGVRPVSMDLVYVVLAALIGALVGMLPHSPLKPYQWSVLAVGLIHSHLLGLLVVCALAFAAPYVWKRSLIWKAFAAAVGMGVVVWLFFAILGSLGTPPEMKLKSIGYGLMWYTDFAAANDGLPQAIVYSLPLWIYRGLMLIWALWVVVFVLNTVKRIWAARTDLPTTPPEIPMD